MAQILKYIGKGQWMTVDSSEVSDDHKTIELKKARSTPNEKSNLFFENLQNDIQSNGYRTIKLSNFLSSLDVKKRTTKALSAIQTILKSHGLYALPEFLKN